MTLRLHSWIQGAFRVLGAEIRERWRRVLLLSLAGVIAYQLFLLAPFALFGSFPNYFKLYDAWAGIVESIQLRPPLAKLWALVMDQPVYEFGIRDRFGFIALQFVASTHNLVTMVLLPPLVVLSLLLLARGWSALRRGPSMAVRVAGVSTSTVASLFGASTSAVACCGGSGGPVFLTLLGFGFGTAGAIVEYAEVLEVGGYVLLIGNLLGLAGWLGRRASVGICSAGDAYPVFKAAAVQATPPGRVLR